MNTGSKSRKSINTNEFEEVVDKFISRLCELEGINIIELYDACELITL